MRNREVDGSVRRRESVLGLTAEGDIDGNGTHNFIGEPLDRRRSANDGGDAGVAERRTGRDRSLSGTLEGLWRGIRGVGSRENFRDGDGTRDDV